MCSADGIECLLTRLEASIQINLAYLLYISRAKAGRPRGIVQMVGIVQTEAAARLFQLLGREAFERGLSSDWHEQGQLDGAMREMQCCRAGFRGLGGKKESEPWHIPTTTSVSQTGKDRVPSIVPASRTSARVMRALKAYHPAQT